MEGIISATTTMRISSGDVLDFPGHAAQAATGQRPCACNASGLPLHFVGKKPIAPPKPRWIRQVTKRALDIALSGIALMALLPLLMAIAASIKATSPGPVIFRQVRTGLGGQPITIYKFRTFYFHACDPTGISQATDNDPRVTPLGRFLRRANLDELPQLLNILRGDMSLVGPRPHAPGLQAAGMRYELLVPFYSLRQLAKPGLSGWAQVNGYRGPTDQPRAAYARIEHDLAYIQNFSLRLDLKIIALTLYRELRGGSGT